MTQTAKVYGNALYELAQSEKQSKEILQQLQSLSQAFAAEPAFITLLSTPSISKEERCLVLDRSFRGKLNPYTLNFLKLLTEQDKIRHFHGCCRQFRLRYNEDNNILPVRAVTAVTVSPALRKKLETKLAAVTGKRLEMTYAVDPKCLGGVQLDMDGARLDDTVRHRLNDLRNILKNTVL
jgi:F-type H+-transporting ATPase subunit delta